MTANIGATDRMIRIILGLACLSALYWVEGDLRYLGLIGIVFLGTAFIKFCPAYWIFGKRSCK